jgi:heme oxygenase (biliverdin-IX-beta and delta-forming)
MTLTLLRDYTRSSHQSLEKLLIPKIKNIRERKDYAEILALFYGYFKPLEEQIEKHVNKETIPDMHHRRKSSAILSDYQHVHGINEMSVCEDMPVIENEAQCLGAMYVMEGSTLGGKIIAQMITRHLDVEMEKGITFFNGYGAETEQMWEKFTTSLNEFDSKGTHTAQMAAAAEETFLKFRSWILEN